MLRPKLSCSPIQVPFIVSLNITDVFSYYKNGKKESSFVLLYNMNVRRVVMMRMMMEGNIISKGSNATLWPSLSTTGSSFYQRGANMCLFVWVVGQPACCHTVFLLNDWGPAEPTPTTRT